MKRINYLKAVISISFLYTGIIFTSFSCGEYKNHEESKVIAEEQNEANLKNKNQQGDAQFLLNAAEFHMKEIFLGQLAQTNGNLTHVKEIGREMETEHTKALKGLKHLSDQKLIMLPPAPTEDAQNAINTLTEKSPADFDKDYCIIIITEHKDAIYLFEKVSAESTDQDVKAWAKSSLPALKTNLEHAITCQKKCDKMQ